MKRVMPPILWMALIFIVSTDFGSMENTRSFLVPILRFLFPTISHENLGAFLFLMRKSAHMIEYAILAVLWFFALNRKSRASTLRPVSLALGISCLYAGLDELHHTFVSSRTGSLVDVGIDSVGAVIGLTIWKGSRFLELSPSNKIKLKYFGWWFAWGIFSSIMLLTITRGGPLSFLQMVLVMLGIGIIAGSAGVAYYVRRK